VPADEDRPRGTGSPGAVPPVWHPMESTAPITRASSEKRVDVTCAIHTSGRFGRGTVTLGRPAGNALAHTPVLERGRGVHRMGRNPGTGHGANMINSNMLRCTRTWHG